MNIDQLRKRFPDEDACRLFFESILWKHDRSCPHCYSLKSYRFVGHISEGRLSSWTP